MPHATRFRPARRIHDRAGRLAALALALALAVPSAARPAHAQRAPAPPPAQAVAPRPAPPSAAADERPGPGAVPVRGLVFDSLAGRPLAGAAVFVEGIAAMAVADSAGRFTVSAPPGRQLLTAEHPALAGLGLSALTAAVDVAADAPAVVLATPGRASVWRRMCGTEPPADSADAAILYGDVRDARTDARLAGAVARVSWQAVGVERGRLRAQPVTLEARTDSLGVYTACGLPRGAALEVAAEAGPHASGRAPVDPDARGLARVNLLVARDATTPGVRLAGTVRDTTGQPLPDVRVEVDGLEGITAATDAAGQFAFPLVPAGTRTVVLRAVGYAPVTVPVALRTPTADPVDLTLRRVTQLARVTVRASAPQRKALHTAIAARQRAAQSDLADSTVFRRTGQLRTALAALPFVQTTGQGDWRVELPSTPADRARGRERCAARVFVDELESSWDVARDLPTDQIAAVEVFRRATRIPSHGGGTSTLGGGSCGAVLIWTTTAL